MENKISLVIPHVPFSPEADEMLDKCLSTLSGYDEFILVVNDGIGYGKAFNRGFKYAKGDYIFAVSNDTKLLLGSLQEMCIPNTVTYSENAQWGCFFCLPRTVYEKIGGFDERFEGAYFEDDDYLKRLELAGIPCERVTGVVVAHKGGVTVKALGKEEEYSQANRKRFEEKYK